MQRFLGATIETGPGQNDGIQNISHQCQVILHGRTRSRTAAEIVGLTRERWTTYWGISHVRSRDRRVYTRTQKMHILTRAKHLTVLKMYCTHAETGKQAPKRLFLHSLFPESKKDVSRLEKKRLTISTSIFCGLFYTRIQKKSNLACILKYVVAIRLAESLFFLLLSHSLTTVVPKRPTTAITAYVYHTYTRLQCIFSGAIVILIIIFNVER